MAFLKQLLILTTIFFAAVAQAYDKKPMKMLFDVPVFVELNDRAEELSRVLLKELGTKENVSRYLRTRGFKDVRLMSLQSSVSDFVKSSPFTMPGYVVSQEFNSYYASQVKKPISGLLRFSLLNVAIFSNWWAYREASTWRDFGTFNVQRAQDMADCVLLIPSYGCEKDYSVRGMTAVRRYMSSIILAYFSMTFDKDDDSTKNVQLQDVEINSVDYLYETSMLYHFTTIAALNSRIGVYPYTAWQSARNRYNKKILEYEELAKIASKYIVDFENL